MNTEQIMSLADEYSTYPGHSVMRKDLQAAVEALVQERDSAVKAAKYAKHIDATPENQRETMLYDALKERDALSKLADKWNFECDELREDNKRLDAEVKTLKGELALWQNPNRSVIREMAALVAENKTLRDALERTLTALENEGPTFWSAEQDAARAALGETK